MSTINIKVGGNAELKDLILGDHNNKTVTNNDLREIKALIEELSSLAKDGQQKENIAAMNDAIEEGNMEKFKNHLGNFFTGVLSGCVANQVPAILSLLKSMM